IAYPPPRPTVPDVRRLGRTAKSAANCCSNVGRAIALLEDWRRAQRWFERAARFDPNSSRAWIGIGRCCSNGGPVGLVTDPRLGVVRGESGDPEQAVAAFSRALSIAPTSTD